MGRNNLVLTALLVGVFVAQFFVSPAYGQGSDAVTDLVTRAGQARAEQRYEEAIELLTKAYEIYPDPRILFNTAKVYEDFADCQNALRYYVRTSDMAATKADEFAELLVAVEQTLTGFECGEDRETFAALLLSYSESPHAAVAMNIAAHYERQGECVKAREMAVRAKDNALASPTTRSSAEETLGRLVCPDEGDGDGAGSITTISAIAYGLGGVGVVSLVLAILADRSTAEDIDEFESRAEPAFRAACPDRESLADDPSCKAAYSRASTLEDDIASGQSTTLLALSAGTLLLGAGATLWYLEHFTDVFDDGDGVSFRVLPLISEDAVGGVFSLDID